MSDFTKNPVELGAKPISKEETFHFNCTLCGNCCRYRMNDVKDTNIFLSGPDVRRIAKFLDMDIENVINKYLTITLNENLGLYVCQLKIRTDGCCRFLKKGQCSIYEARPRTCAMYPLGREIDLGVKKGEIIYTETKYVLSSDGYPYQCKKSDTEPQYTVEEWLQKNNVPIDDKEDIEWFKILLDTCRKVKRINKNRRTDFQKSALKKLYIKYKAENSHD